MLQSLQEEEGSFPAEQGPKYHLWVQRLADGRAGRGQARLLPRQWAQGTWQGPIDRACGPAVSSRVGSLHPEPEMPVKGPVCSGLGMKPYTWHCPIPPNAQRAEM